MKRIHRLTQLTSYVGSEVLANRLGRLPSWPPVCHAVFRTQIDEAYRHVPTYSQTILPGIGDDLFHVLGAWLCPFLYILGDYKFNCRECVWVWYKSFVDSLLRIQNYLFLFCINCSWVWASNMVRVGLMFFAPFIMYLLFLSSSTKTG